jgi:hypothetical protein
MGEKRRESGQNTPIGREKQPKTPESGKTMIGSKIQPPLRSRLGAALEKFYAPRPLK